MVRIKWTPKAIIDLNNIAEFIAKESIKYARLTVKTIKLKTKVLIHQPKIGRAVPEINNDNIRELIQGNYRIIYWIENEQTVHILTIHHSSRLLPSIT